MKILLKIKLLVLTLTISCNLSNSSAMQTDYKSFNMGSNAHAISPMKHNNTNLPSPEIAFNHENQVIQEMEIPSCDIDVAKLLTDDNEKQITIRRILNETNLSDTNVLTITQEENDKVRDFFNKNVKRNLLSVSEKETVNLFWDFFTGLEPKLQTSFLPIGAMLGHPNAQVWYSMQLGNDEKEKKSHFLNLAASQGHPVALLELSRVVSEEIAYPLLKLASLKGSHDAQLIMVRSLSDNSSKHLSEAQIALLKIFIESGNPFAEDYLNYAISSDSDSENEEISS